MAIIHRIIKASMVAAVALVLAFQPSTVKAQESAPYADNTFFLSLGVGGTYNMPGKALGLPSGGLYLSRWLMKPLAFRVAVEMVSGPAFTTTDGGTGTGMSFLGSAQFMWDVNATFCHVYNKTFPYPIFFYPLIGLGAIYTTTGGDSYSADFQAMLGAHIPVRIGPKWDFFLEYKCNFFPENYFDDGPRTSYMHTAIVGLTRRWSDNPYHRRTGFESRNTSEDWFTGYGVGALFNSYEFEYMFDGKAKLWNITGDMMVGRNYSNIWTIRFELSGFFARHRAFMNTTTTFDENGDEHTTQTMNPGSWYIFNALHTDFMINLSHLGDFRRGKKWNFLPYMGAGPVWRYKDPSFGLGADFGLMCRRYIDNMGDFFIDAKYFMVPPRIAGGAGPSGSILGVGYLMFTVGYISNWGHSTTRYRMPVNSCVD